MRLQIIGRHLILTTLKNEIFLLISLDFAELCVALFSFSNLKFIVDFF